MPLPFIAAAVGLGAAALFGGKKAYDGYKDNKEAERLHERAKSVSQEAQRELSASKENAQVRFEELGAIKQKVVETTLKRYATFVDRANIESNSKDIHISTNALAHFQEVRMSIGQLESAVGSAVAGAGAGALAGFGAFGGAGLLATASTGTAISSLSGVAATNATLAWFGGGSLAAGGFGMAGGAAMLGGIVVAPVILVAGLVFSKAAEKRKYDAQAYYDTVRSAAEAMQNEANLWDHAGYRASEMIESVMTLDAQLKELMPEILAIVKKNSNFFMRLFGLWNRKGSRGYEVSKWSKDEQVRLQAMMQNAETLTNIINSPILSDNDSTTRRIIDLQRECQDLMDEISRRWGNS